MEEKLIVKSVRCNVKLIFWAFFAIGLAAGGYYVIDWFGRFGFDYWTSQDAAAVLLSLAFVAAGALIGGILFAWLSKYEITITDKRVYGRAAFGKRVDLPLDSVSAVGTCMFSGVSVSSSSGRISFLFVKNCDEIHKCVSDLLIERQSKAAAAPVTTIKQEIPQSNAEELKKYKDLLDMGVISQEEFEAKKKQLLGL